MHALCAAATLPRASCVAFTAATATTLVGSTLAVGYVVPRELWYTPPPQSPEVPPQHLKEACLTAPAAVASPKDALVRTVSAPFWFQASCGFDIVHLYTHTCLHACANAGVDLLCLGFLTAARS